MICSYKTKFRLDIEKYLINLGSRHNQAKQFRKKKKSRKELSKQQYSQ